MNNQQIADFITKQRYERHPITPTPRKSVMCRIIEWYHCKRKVKKINKALAVVLTDWQIRYIFCDQATPLFVSISRCEGKTLAHILFLLLNPVMDGVTIHTINWKSDRYSQELRYDIRYLAMALFAEDYEHLHRQIWFMSELLKIQKALNDVGIKTNNITIRR